MRIFGDVTYKTGEIVGTKPTGHAVDKRHHDLHASAMLPPQILPPLASNPTGLVLMVDVEEDHAVVLDLVAEVALHLHLPPLLAAEFAPVVDEAVVAPADVLLQPAMVLAVHPAVGVGGMIEEAVDHDKDPAMSRRVVFLDLRKLCRKGWGGKIDEHRHGALLAAGKPTDPANVSGF